MTNKKINVLVSNDDGINAQGIHEIVKALSRHAHVYVAAPHVQRSAAGHSITLRGELEVVEKAFEGAETAFEITGTPADCVKLGVLLLKNRGIDVDMVFSGINHGGNLGTDTLYSGTVSAAIEGSICGVPSVAVSIDNHDTVNFEPAANLAAKTLLRVYGKLDAKTVLNINLPDVPEEELKGVKYTVLGPREYDAWFKDISEGEKVKYTYTGEPVVYDNLPENYDVMAVQTGYASITPLQYDFTNYKLVEEIAGWGIIE